MCVDQEESWEERVVAVGWRVKKGGKEYCGMGWKVGGVVVVGWRVVAVERVLGRVEAVDILGGDFGVVEGRGDVGVRMVGCVHVNVKLGGDAGNLGRHSLEDLADKFRPHYLSPPIQRTTANRCPTNLSFRVSGPS